MRETDRGSYMVMCVVGVIGTWILAVTLSYNIGVQLREITQILDNIQTNVMFIADDIE
ncbi:hypothetical protein OAG36_00490 [bacterium]|nr:hypothetical protein [bacterium]